LARRIEVQMINVWKQVYDVPQLEVWLVATLQCYRARSEMQRSVGEAIALRPIEDQVELDD